MLVREIDFNEAMNYAENITEDQEFIFWNDPELGQKGKLASIEKFNDKTLLPIYKKKYVLGENCIESRHIGIEYIPEKTMYTPTIGEKLYDTYEKCNKMVIGSKETAYTKLFLIAGHATYFILEDLAKRFTYADGDLIETIGPLPNNIIDITITGN